MSRWHSIGRNHLRDYWGISSNWNGGNSERNLQIDIRNKLEQIHKYIVEFAGNTYFEITLRLFIGFRKDRTRFWDHSDWNWNLPYSNWNARSYKKQIRKSILQNGQYGNWKIAKLAANQCLLLSRRYVIMWNCQNWNYPNLTAS